MVEDVELSSSVSRSGLARLPRETLDRVLDRAADVRFGAGSDLRRPGEHEPACYLLVSGLVRTYLTSSAGRQLTIRYCSPGSLLGLATLFATGHAPMNHQAVTPSRLLALSPARIRELARVDVHVAHVLLFELSDRVVTYMNAVGEVAFASVHDRILTHLLDMATLGPRHSEAAVHISQQDLADQVGTVREVVVRILRDLRTAGLVRTERDRIVLLDLERWGHVPRVAH